MSRKWIAVIPITFVGFVVAQNGTQQFDEQFTVSKSALTSIGRSDYFILEPGYKCEYAGGDTKLVITVLKDTEKVDGVETRVVEEREWEDGSLIEVSRNFFAIEPKSGDVYYFGEDVDMIKDGKVVSHDGAWRSGVNGAKFGLMMPGKPKVGQAFYQEIAPKVAMDRAKIIATDYKLKTPAGIYEKCVRTEETTPLEPGAKESKVYAPGIGLVQDADVKLTKVFRS